MENLRLLFTINLGLSIVALCSRNPYAFLIVLNNFLGGIVRDFLVILLVVKKEFDAWLW